MNYDDLIKEAKSCAEKNYLSKEKLGQDEELQLLSCGYSILFLSACTNKTMPELGQAHEFIAKCFGKIGDQAYAQRHLRTASGYLAKSK
mgnify:CR=1 FL=1